MMNLLHVVPRWLLVACIVSVPIRVAAQRNSPVPLTDPQKRGEAWFLQKCPLCHIHSNQKKALEIQASSELTGLFKDGSVTDAAVRQVILDGVPGRMPAFRYSLKPAELDDLIAYLKVRVK